MRVGYSGYSYVMRDVACSWGIEEMLFCACISSDCSRSLR